MACAIIQQLQHGGKRSAVLAIFAIDQKLHHRPTLHVLQARAAVTDIAVPALIIHLQEIHEWNVFLLIDSLAHLVNHLRARLANDDR